MVKISKNLLINFVKLSSVDLVCGILAQSFIDENSYYFAKID